MATSQDFVNWVCSDALDPRFLQQALLAEGKHLLNFGMGTTHTTIYFPAVLAFHISLAPAREQQRIVERVEALLEQVNRAKGRLDRVPQILKRFRQSVLAAACSGELTREWRKQHVDGGSAAKLLDELFVQRRRDHEQQLSRARGTGARKPITPKNLAPARVPDGLSELPDGWAWVLFDDVCDDITVGHVGPMANEYVERGVPFLRSQNVRPFRFDPLGLKFITPAFHQRLVKSSLRPGDIAIVRSGNAGEACVVPPELPEANCADLVVMRPSRILNPIFAVIFINSSAARTHIDDVKVGIAQGHYNIGSARETPVPLPPLAEQVEIVRQVERLFALADTIERRVQAATARAEKLPQAILSKAFAGELVPTEAELARAEGRTYETAEKLLKRVTATAAAPSAKAGAKKRGKAS
jgi:type I restriction enzyme S subunit